MGCCTYCSCIANIAFLSISLFFYLHNLPRKKLHALTAKKINFFYNIIIIYNITRLTAKKKLHDSTIFLHIFLMRTQCKNIALTAMHLRTNAPLPWGTTVVVHEGNAEMPMTPLFGQVEDALAT